ncbi:MAG: hypothetical protein ACPGU5_06470 [Lishizhenia sp.]
MCKLGFFLFLLGSMFSASAQIKAVEIADISNIQLSPDSTYSRSIKVNDSVLYAACSNGAIYLYDFKKEKVSEVFGYEVEELRDIEIMGNGNVVAMMSGSTGKFVKIGPGSRTSTDEYSVLENVFLDGMDFSPSGTGALMGDPIDNKFSVFFSVDFGSSYEEVFPSIEAKSGEAGYAASGTNIQMITDRLFYFVSGGIVSRLFKVDLSDFDAVKTSNFEIPIQNGEGKGAFSMYFKDSLEGIVVGGDYKNPKDTLNACFYTLDGGVTWNKPKKSFGGYKSCVIYNPKYKVLFASGRTGVDYSLDFGQSWRELTASPMFSLTFFGENLLGTTRNGIIKQIELKFIE